MATSVEAVARARAGEGPTLIEALIAFVILSVGLLGIVSLLWFAGGANDYVMTKTQNAAYLGMARALGVAEALALFRGIARRGP